MKIYRGNIGVDLSLEELGKIMEEDEQIDDLLNLIYELEMDEVMSYPQEEMNEFEEALLKEVAELQRKQNASSEILTMERIVKHLKKYGR